MDKKFVDYFQNIPLKLRKVEDHKYELYVDMDKDQILLLKNYPGSSIMGIPIDTSPSGALLNSTNNEIYFTKYSYIDTLGIICQNIHIDYTSSSTGDFKIIITRYRKDPVFHFDISNFDYIFSADDLFNDSSIMNIFFVREILLYFNIEDLQASITNLTILDSTTEGTYIIKTGSTLHTIIGLGTNIKFSEGKAPTFEVNKTYILKVTYDAKSNNYYCTDVKSFSNT